MTQELAKLKFLLFCGHIPQDMFLTFQKGKLVDYQRSYPEFVEVIEDFTKVLIDLKMISFFDDVPNMTVNVPVWDIDESGEWYIETFHSVKNENNNIFTELHDRGCDVPMKWDDFKSHVFNL